MAILIFLIIGMHIWAMRFLKVGLFNAQYDLEKKLYKEYINANWDNNSEIEEVIAADNNKDNNEENFQEKNRELIKKKQYPK